LPLYRLYLEDGTDAGAAMIVLVVIVALSQS
jgi:hypothetical protein